MEALLNLIIENLSHLIEVGGFIMPPLMIATLVLWYGLGARIVLLRRGSKRSVRSLVERYHLHEDEISPKGVIDQAVVAGLKIKKSGRVHVRRYLDDCFSDFNRPLNKHARLIRTIVIVAPLAGLLGTVTGMIETFNSLADMTLFSQTGGIAGGISQAMFTTQMGLAVAIPGLILDRILKKKQTRIERELAQLKDILCSSDFDEMTSKRV